MDKLIKALKEGVVTVVFEKIDTKEIRSMACTLNSEVANLSTSITNQSPNCSTIVMYALDRKAWRDVRVDTIQKWYIGYPEENT